MQVTVAVPSGEHREADVLDELPEQLALLAGVVHAVLSFGPVRAIEPLKHRTNESPVRRDPTGL
jgi:hypothetical protein